MSTAKQIAANCANALKSTGPRTEAGKRASRVNARTHGLSGQTILRTDEEHAGYETYSARLMPDLSPHNAVELDFAERIVFDSWRLRRAGAIEQNLFALAEAAFDTGNTVQDDALNDAHAWQLNDKSFNLLSLYQQRLQRSIHRDLEMLRKMQKERRAQPHLSPQMLSFVGASAAARAPQLVHKPAPPPENGFVCPTPPTGPPPPPPPASNDPSNMAA